MPAIDEEKLRAQLKPEEGLRLYAYHDGGGVPTIGYGHTRGVGIGLTCTPSQAEQWLTEDCQSAQADVARALPWASTLDDVRQRVVIDLDFNLGIAGLLKFNAPGGTLEAIRTGLYELAATRLLSNERWVSEVGPRASRLAGMLRTGHDPV